MGTTRANPAGAPSYSTRISTNFWLTTSTLHGYRASNPAQECPKTMLSRNGFAAAVYRVAEVVIDARVCSAGVDSACCGLTKAKDPQVTYGCTRPTVAHHRQRQVVLRIGPGAGATEPEMAVATGELFAKQRQPMVAKPPLHRHHDDPVPLVVLDLGGLGNGAARGFSGSLVLPEAVRGDCRPATHFPLVPGQLTNSSRRTSWGWMNDTWLRHAAEHNPQTRLHRDDGLGRCPLHSQQKVG